MADTTLTKDPVTLDDLKRAIEIAEYWRGTTTLERAQGRAWRMAFEWYAQLIERHAALSETVGACSDDWAEIDREQEEGMTLIREKLQS